MKVILASKSPRRIKLLKKIIKSFSVVPSGLDENQIREKDPLTFALKAAEAKARVVAESNPEALVIAADTVVIIDGQVLGKPRHREEAQAMLQSLSGRTHQVITAVVLYHKQSERQLSGYESSRVTFKLFRPEEIEIYLDRNTYRDKAGAYAIQEVRSTFVEKLEGDYQNVVGLPLRLLRRLINRFQEQTTQLPISGFRLPAGLGLAQSQDRTFEVPGAYPGDLVEISYLPSAKPTIKARLLAVVQPGPARQQAPCPHFGPCGGCAFQDLSYAEQLRQKQNYLLEVLQSYFPLSYRYLEIDQPLPSPAQYFYRNKMEFSFGQADGRVYLGQREKTRPGGRRPRKKVVPLEICHLSTPLTAKLFPLISRLAQESGLPVFDLETKTGFYRHLVIREGKRTGQLMLLLVTTSQAELPRAAFREEILRAVPGLTSLWWVENDRLADVVALEKSHLLYGQEAIEEQLLGYRFKIYPGSFFQTNPLAAELVYARIQAEARRLRTQSALGLYCGSGAIEICLSKAATEVVGVDWDPANIRTASENLALNGIGNVRFLESSVEAALPEISLGTYDLLLIDPPRAGLSPRSLKQIVGLKIPGLIYVSCNPATLARDLKALVDSGYKISRLTPVDFFPHTGHLEVIAYLNL
ncbi:MAG: 23S rRNA (uracil(1939)-C(5))-methyltransferase RlmD [Candidatus Saccharicenans sp.]|jgi:23S rRNA (uracil1939-C5)-methyltransferase|nr:23S rRNA (uracil(1939)-C(5))-methyltransferase RlmD [Candidatus Saccharicenans sp.]MDH7493140.1 23S rRNA (uracil(1939)-C(5))-methyltransferase RlmD [Candidatus Saccharicenans sp.]